MPNNTEIKVEITNVEHPHFGERGVLTGKIIKMVWGEQMVEVKLNDCPGLIDACFVKKGEVKQIT